MMRVVRSVFDRARVTGVRTAADDVTRALDEVVERAYAGVVLVAPRRSLGDERRLVAARA